MPRLRCSGRRRSPRALRRATRIAVCVVGLLIWGSVATAQEREAAGRIKIAAGSVFIVRANNTMPAKAGQDVYEADTLKTGADGSVEFVVDSPEVCQVVTLEVECDFHLADAGIETDASTP